MSFMDSDQGKKGYVDREEFESLITGYFEMWGIAWTKDNFDKYFNRIDSNDNGKVNLEEFINFSDEINIKEVFPALSREMKRRGLQEIKHVQI